MFLPILFFPHLFKLQLFSVSSNSFHLRCSEVIQVTSKFPSVSSRHANGHICTYSHILTFCLHNKNLLTVLHAHSSTAVSISCKKLDCAHVASLSLPSNQRMSSPAISFNQNSKRHSGDSCLWRATVFLCSVFTTQLFRRVIYWYSLLLYFLALFFCSYNKWILLLWLHQNNSFLKITPVSVTDRPLLTPVSTFLVIPKHHSTWNPLYCTLLSVLHSLITWWILKVSKLPHLL